MLGAGLWIAPAAIPFPLPILFALFGALIALRLYARHRALTRPAEHDHNFAWIAAGSLCGNGLWGIIIVSVQLATGVGLAAVVYAFFTCGIATGSVAALAPNAKLQRASLAVLITPVIAVVLLGYGVPAFAILHAIFLAYTLVMGHVATREFWQNVAANDKLRENEVELRQAQKLEAVGRLAAGIAHEINTPVQYITDSATFLGEGIGDLDASIAKYRALVTDIAAQRTSSDAAVERADQIDAEHDLDYLRANFAEATERVMTGLARVTKIVRATREFARSSNTKAPEDLNAAIKSTLVVCHHETGNVADVITDLGALPLVNCHGGELNQVFLNVIINAAHAIGDSTPSQRGTIRVKTWAPGDGWVKIAISDTGHGIPSDIIDKIFDPFFTTKPVGKGSGQGLAIARSIVVGKHGGKLEVASQPGVGTTFTIALPQ
jgi:signal transduction histidine kinase